MNPRKTESQSSCAKKLKTLGDSTRLAVLQLLMSGPKHVGEMNAVLGVQQTLLSHHLKVLRQEGLVTATRDGKAVLYRLAPAVGTNEHREIDLGCCVISFN